MKGAASDQVSTRAEMSRENGVVGMEKVPARALVPPLGNVVAAPRGVNRPSVLSHSQRIIPKTVASSPVVSPGVGGASSVLLRGMFQD